MTKFTKKSQSLGYWSLLIGYYLVPPGRDCHVGAADGKFFQRPKVLQTIRFLYIEV
jgi:hypothetical protein